MNILPRRLWRRAPSRFRVDRFSVLDGCVVATGWEEGGTPRLLRAGRAVRGVSCVTFQRRDLKRIFGPATSARGFRLSAALRGEVDAGDLALRFGSTKVTPATVSADLEATPGLISADYGRMMAAFVAEMNGRPARLLEIGSRARSGNTYRGLFPSHVDYVGLDVTAGPNVDVVGDAHHLHRHVEGVFDFIFSISVFEHLLMPWKVALEMNRVMAAGGLAFIQSHAAWPLHDEPWDFFRFSRDAWRGLFNAHTGFEIVESGHALHGSILPRHASGAALAGLDAQPTFLLSACLVRKMADPKVAWDAEVGDVYDLSYSHAD